LISRVQSGPRLKRLFQLNQSRIGILLDQNHSEMILKICSYFKKSPEKFINDIIDSTHQKIQMLELEWEDDI